MLYLLYLYYQNKTHSLYIFENYNMQIAVCVEENLTKVVRGNSVAFVNIFNGKLEYC